MLDSSFAFQIIFPFTQFTGHSRTLSQFCRLSHRTLYLLPPTFSLQPSTSSLLPSTSRVKVRKFHLQPSKSSKLPSTLHKKPSTSDDFGPTPRVETSILYVLVRRYRFCRFATGETGAHIIGSLLSSCHTVARAQLYVFINCQRCRKCLRTGY